MRFFIALFAILMYPIGGVLFEPFASDPSSRGGLMIKKILLAILILLIAGIAYLYVNKDKIARMAVEKSVPLIESSLLDNIPADVNKEEVKEVFARVDARIKEGKIDFVQMQGLILNFRDALKDQKVDSVEFHKVYEAMKKLAGQ